MDGTGRQPLVQGGSVQSPIGITLDYQEDKVYWVDESLDIIWKMDLDGGECLTKDEGFSSGKGTQSFLYTHEAFSPAHPTTELNCTYSPARGTVYFVIQDGSEV